MSFSALIKLAKETRHEWQTVSTGTPTERMVAGTVGRVNPVTLITSIADPRIYNDAIKDPGWLNDKDIEEDDEDPKARLIRKILKKMQKGSDGQLDDVAIRVGGTNILSDIKRTLTNPRTTLAGKALGLIGTPLSFLSNTARGAFYNPLAHSVTVYSDNPAILTHELGHAIDMNSGKRPEIHNVREAITNELRNIPKDAYRLAPVIFNSINGAGALTYPYKLFTELQANRRGELAIDKTFSEKENELIKSIRNKSLIAAYGSYVGSALPLRNLHIPGTGMSVAVGPLAGLATGRIAGELAANDKRSVSELTDSLIEEMDSDGKKKKKNVKVIESTGQPDPAMPAMILA